MGQYFKKLEGKLVYLSPVDPDDAPIFTRWLADLEVTKYLTMSHLILSLTSEKDFLTKMATGNDNFTIVDAATDKPLGACGFVGPDPIHRTAEIGIFLGEKEFWGRGYGTDALNLLLDFGFNVRNFHNILLRVKAFNVRAIKSYEKAGFRVIGVRRECDLHGETYGDTVYMDLLAREFQGTLERRLTQ